MTVYDCQLVILPDGSAWVRREDVMVRWPGDPEALVPAGDFVAVAIEEAALPKPKGTKAKATAKPAPAPHTDGPDWHEAERMYREDGEKLTVIAERLGIPYSTLYARAKREAWAA